jgi:hypothetical protein
MKNYNESWIKHRARAIKKENQIPHHEALDIASRDAGFKNWNHFLNSSIPVTKPVQAGMLVRVKEPNCLAVAVSQYNESVECYSHWGDLHCLRHEITICRDQTQAVSFRPMRIVMPYGKWKCADGTEVLFNRDYRPIWKRHPNGTVEAADPDEWVKFTSQEYLFGDHNTPDGNRETYRICINQLRDWNVENAVPTMLKWFREAVLAGDLSRLEKPSIFDNSLESRG